MPLSFRTLLLRVGTLGVIGAGALAFISTLPSSTQPVEQAETAQAANVGFVETTTTRPEVETQDTPTYSSEPAAPEQQNDPAASAPALSAAEGPEISVVARIPDPYPFPPLPFEAVNDRARAALVNILCTSGDENLRPISGSGVIIDPRGVILTNAHVAQYLLLAESTEIRLSCIIRSGAPARPMWSAEVLYIPPVWVEDHAADITRSNPTSTGEHDYALLRIIGPVDTRVPNAFDGNYPALPFDVREAISFPDDLMLVTAYPAEFVGSTATRLSLHPISSISPISELLTFHANTVDLVSFEGAAEAQSGSSGGPVVNAWGYMTGIITTTSEGLTTADRELRAITASYIDRDLATRTGSGLAAILAGDLIGMANNFRANQAPILTKLLVDQILKRLL